LTNTEYPYIERERREISAKDAKNTNFQIPFRDLRVGFASFAFKNDLKI
jgi:hypothetical protein